jgi:hypothetical protein
MKDAHLLVMRELVSNPGMNFNGLQQATGMGDEQLARVLSTLYVVGSITSNAKRAMAGGSRTVPVREAAVSEQSVYFSVMDSTPRPSDLQGRPPNDLTAPLPLMPDPT